MKKSHAVKKSKPKVQEEIQKGRPKEISTVEIRNVVADTIERMYEEMGGTINRPSAEQWGILVAGALKHGLLDGYQAHPTKLRERTMKSNLCKACR